MTNPGRGANSRDKIPRKVSRRSLHPKDFPEDVVPEWGRGGDPGERNGDFKLLDFKNFKFSRWLFPALLSCKISRKN